MMRLLRILEKKKKIINRIYKDFKKLIKFICKIDG